MPVIIDPNRWDKGPHLPGLKPFNPYDPEYAYDPRGQERWETEQMAQAAWNMQLHMPGTVGNQKLICPTWGMVVNVGNKKGFFAIAMKCGKGKHSPREADFAKMYAAVQRGEEPGGFMKYAKPIFCCRHCVDQDEVHPDGIVLMPHGFYVCQTCFNLIERKKFKHAEELVSQCHHCVQDEVDRIVARDPSLFVDLMAKPKG